MGQRIRRKKNRKKSRGTRRRRQEAQTVNREDERMLSQIDREIDVENTKGAILGSVLSVSFIFVMILYWIFVGY